MVKMETSTISELLSYAQFLGMEMETAGSKINALYAEARQNPEKTEENNYAARSKIRTIKSQLERLEKATVEIYEKTKGVAK